jgi:two-component system, LytTR family, sensor histidine kinase AlgZ
MDASSHRNRLIFLHASFWAVYISFIIYARSSFQRPDDINWSRVLSTSAMHIIPAMLFSYLNYFYLIPQYLSRKRVALFIAFFLIGLVVFVYSRIYMERYFIDGFTEKEEYLYRTRFIVSSFFSFLSIALFVSLLRFAVEWMDIQTTRKEMEKEKLTAELNFLKAQVNPHFLFNTLNNLYYLAYSKSDNTTEVIEKLSAMMRYMIYDSNTPQVQLIKEIDYMQNYISLEKLRLNDKVKINFTIDGDTDTVRIVPLVLITFLENAFKHGASNSGSWVSASLHCTPKQLRFEVANNKSTRPTTEEKSGIGLQNVRRRLDLSYPNQHQLQIEDSPAEFRVQLVLTFT